MPTMGADGSIQNDPQVSDGKKLPGQQAKQPVPLTRILGGPLSQAKSEESGSGAKKVRDIFNNVNNNQCRTCQRKDDN